MDDDSYQEALKTSLAFLSNRPRSINEVVEKLKKKKVVNEVIDRVV